MRPIIHTRKHYVQNSLATIAGSAKLDLVFVEAVEAGAQGDVDEVTEGAVVKAIFIEEWLRTQSTSPGSYIACLYKNPGGSTPFTTVELAAMGDAENKKNVLFFSQGLLNDQDADATPIMRGWYNIPKTKQRWGLGDRLVLAIFAQGALDLTICGFSTYKELT